MSRVALGLIWLLAASPAVAQVLFQPPFPLNTDAASDASYSDEQPRIVGDGAGHLVAAWISNRLAALGHPLDRDIFVARSSDGGSTWTDPAPLNTNAASDQGGDDGLSLATDRAGNWLAVWTSRDTLNATIGSDPDILVARSTDDGATWTDPMPVNTDAATDMNDVDERPAVAIDRNGHAIAAWQTLALAPHPKSDMGIVVARSTDAGATWSDPQPLATPAAHTNWQASVAGDGAGHWVIVWRSDDTQGGPLQDGDLLVSTSGDDGITWSAPAPLNDDAATDDHPDAEPEVLTDEAGTWLTLWTTYGGVRLARSTDNGATWSPADTIYVGDAFMPRFATDRAGTWVAAWHFTTGNGTGDLLASSSFDNGLTWLPATPANSNPAAADSMDAQADVASDGLGGWALVWMSNDPFGGTSVDFDILIAKSSAVLCDGSDACPGSRCAMTVAKAAGKYASDRLLCYARALARGLSGDPACESVARNRCDAGFAKAAVFDDCGSGMDLSQVSAIVDDLYEDVSSALEGTTGCDGAKSTAAGKAAAAGLKCHAKALRKGTEPSPACLAKAAARLSAAFATAEGRGGCTALGDAGPIGAAVQSFVGHAVAALGSL
jgi:hypothetical protein